MDSMFWTYTEEPEGRKKRSCPFCGSRDIDRPYTRPDAIFLVSRIFPTVRWRYCRQCARKFWGRRSRPK